MDRRSFMKGAAASVALAPVLPAIAVGQPTGPIISGTITIEQLAAGSISADKITEGPIWLFSKVDGAMDTWMRMACDVGFPKHEDYVAARRHYEELYADDN